MKSSVPFLIVFICLVAAALAGCDESQTVSLSGEVTYADYQSGVIIIEICESESSTHHGVAVSTQTPGDCVKRVVLEAPGEFSTKATISWAETEPEVQIMAYLVPTADSDPWAGCLAGADTSVSVADHSGIELELVAGDCPSRE
jgi:hypothetical protein